MGFEPDFAPKITTVLGHLHGKLQAGFAGGHMQFQNKGLPSRSFGIILADSFGICQGKRVGWSTLDSGSIHTLYDVFVELTTLNRAIHIGCLGYSG